MNDYLCTGSGRPRPEQDNCCRPEPPCHPNPPQDNDDGCCSCRRGFVQTLQMLLRTNLSSLIDFQSFAFVTTDYIVGATLVAPDTTAASYDNLSEELTGTFSRFSPGACDYIDVAGPVYFPVTGEGTATGLTASRLNLCDLLAVAFEPAGEAATDVTANYQAGRALFQQLLTQPRGPRPPFAPYPPYPPTPNYPPYPDPCDECCPDHDNAMGGSESLFAGPLLVATATVLGSIDGVLILANDTDERFYIVCSDDVNPIR